MLGLIPSANIVNNFIPYLNPIATINVKGWTSKHVGESFILNDIYHASILSKLIEETCSYLIAFIFFSSDNTIINFFVGRIAISIIFLIKSIELRTVCIGDLKVSTNVS